MKRSQSSSSEQDGIPTECLMEPRSPCSPTTSPRALLATQPPTLQSSWCRQHKKTLLALVCLSCCIAALALPLRSATLNIVQAAGGVGVHGRQRGHKLPLEELLVTISTDTQRMQLTEATRPLRQNVRTFILTNEPASVQQLAGPGFTERIQHYPVTKTLRKGAADPAAVRATLAPFLAAAAFDNSFTWMLYGHEDTVWMMDGIREFLADVDPGKPLVIAETEDVNDLASIEAAAQGIIPPYRIRTGSGIIISSAVLHSISVDQALEWIASMPEHTNTGVEAMLTYCLWIAGIQLAPPQALQLQNDPLIFDGQHDAAGGGSRLLLNLRSGCSDFTSCQMDRFLASHLESTAFANVLEAETMIRVVASLYTTHLPPATAPRQRHQLMLRIPDQGSPLLPKDGELDLDDEDSVEDFTGDTLEEVDGEEEVDWLSIGWGLVNNPNKVGSW